MTVRTLVRMNGRQTGLVGLTVIVPQRYVGPQAAVPQQEMTIRAIWLMSGDRVGIWFQLPRSYPTGHTYALTGVPREEFGCWRCKPHHVAVAS